MSDVGFILWLIVFYLFPAFCLYKIAKRSKTLNAWMAWIPFLHLVLIFSIANKPSWWIFLIFVPIANIFVYVSAWIKICEVLNEPRIFAFLILIPMVNIIPLGTLAFSK